MGASLLPPRGVFVPNRLLFDHGLSTAYRITLAQLMAMAWSSPGHELPPVSYDTLAGLMGKSASTLYDHFAVLRDYHSALRLRGVGNGLIIVTLGEWLYSTKSGEFPEIREIAKISESAKIPEIRNVKGSESDLDSDQNKNEEEEEEDSDPPPPEFNDLNDSGFRESRKNRNAAGSEPNVLPADLIRDLITAGVFSFLLPEVARSGRKAADLSAMLAWCEEDKPQQPGGLFMARLRACAVVPDRFYGKRCAVCRRVGKHAPDCRMAYADGIP